MSRDMTLNVEVKNVPEWVEKDFKYVVATVVGSTLWFWGATNDYNEALRLLGEDSCNRIILKNGNVFDKDS